MRLHVGRLLDREKGGSARVRSPVAMVMYEKKDSARKMGKMGKALRSMQLVRCFSCRQWCSQRLPKRLSDIGGVVRGESAEVGNGTSSCESRWRGLVLKLSEILGKRQ